MSALVMLAGSGKDGAQAAVQIAMQVHATERERDTNRLGLRRMNIEPFASLCDGF